MSPIVSPSAAANTSSPVRTGYLWIYRSDNGQGTEPADQLVGGGGGILRVVRPPYWMWHHGLVKGAMTKADFAKGFWSPSINCRRPRSEKWPVLFFGVLSGSIRRHCQTRILNRRSTSFSASSTTAEENMKLKVVLEPSDEGGFTVYVPSLPGCVSEGDTEDEALKNIREAIELYLEPVDDDLSGTGKEVREIVL